MRCRRAFTPFLLPLGLLVVLVFASGTSLAAPPTDEDLRLDHFRCYPLSQPPTLLPPPVVFLEDQFDEALDRREMVTVGLPRRFCNPVAKSILHPGRGGDAEILDSDAHLTMYPIWEVGTVPPSVVWQIHLENQFGPQQIYARKPVALALPTQKVRPGGPEHGFPEDLDHFKCYAAKGKPIDLQAELDDQFEGPGPYLILYPRLFCNPVEKTIGTGVPLTPIINPEAHLTCYDIAAPPGLLGFSSPIEFLLDNQFTPNLVPAIAVTVEDLLCVPTRKLKVSRMPGSFTTG